MTNLEIAQGKLDEATQFWARYRSGNPDDRGNPYQRGEAEYHDSRAAVFAAIAQAEAQTRIAECLETLVEALSPDIKSHVADLSEELEQAQNEWMWADKETERLQKRIDELEAQLSVRNGLA